MRFWGMMFDAEVTSTEVAYSGVWDRKAQIVVSQDAEPLGHRAKLPTEEL
jgi:hypothetical protein